MKKCSFGDQCMERITFSCKFISPYLYFCDDHFIMHVTIPGDHVTESVVIKLSPNQKIELLPKFKGLNKYLKSCRKSILDNMKILIEHIEIETWKTLKNIRELEKASVDLILGKRINKESYERIQSITIETNNYISDGVENIKKAVENL